MATNTTNLHLIKPAGSERVQISQINQNMDILDEKIGAVGNTSIQSQVNSLKNQVATTQITNEYSTVLSAINAVAANKTLPFTIQKSGNSAYTDLPAGLTNTCEWNVICIGSSMRITAVLTVYTGGSSRNGFSYTANIYNGSYIFTWQTIDQRRNNLASIASDTTILGLEPGAYQINLSAASNYIPDRYGTLVIDKSAVTYGVATFISTDGHLYVRHMNGANSWHNSWTQLALNSQIVKLSNITENIKSYGGGGTDVDNTSFLLGELSISNKSGLLFYYASGTANLTANDVMVFRLYDGDTLLGGFGSTNLQGKQWISTSGHYKLTATNHTMKLVLTTFGGATIKVPAYNSIVGRLMFIPLPA